MINIKIICCLTLLFQIISVNNILSNASLYSALKSKGLSNELALDSITSYWNKKSYNELGEWLSKNVKERSDLHNLFIIASDLRAVALKKAIIATNNLGSQEIGSEISIGDILQIALFIETNIKNKSGKKFYFDAQKTKLPRSIEVDPENKNIIIYLDSRDSQKVGKGKWKNFNTAILYDVNSPKVIATGFLKIPKKRSWLKSRLLNEVKIVKRLGSQPGIVTAYSILQHRNISKKNDEVVFAEKLYRGGAVREILSKNSYSFTMSEKIQLASDFISGLRSLHKNAIVHRDLHTKNLLVDVFIRDGKREVSGAITDFGRALNLKHISRKSSDKSFSRAKEDISKLGVALYKIFHNKSAEVHREEKKMLNSVVQSRKNEIEIKSKHSSISSTEKFEYLILSMLNSDISKIKTIDEIYKEINEIEELYKSGK